MFCSNLLKRITKRVCLPLLLCLATFSSTAQAEFIATAPGVFQSKSTRYRVIVSYDVTGVFFLVTPPIGLQAFDPSSIKDEDSQHFFISYDAATNRYTQLLIGDKTYRIIGSFTILMDGLRIALDHNNTYLTVTSEQDQAIIGFRGLQIIVSTVGEVASTLLEANQFAEYADLILPYMVKKHGSQQELVLGDKTVTGAHVGLSIQPPPNPCSKDKEFLLLTAEDVGKLKTIKIAGERTAFLANAFVRNIENNLLGNSVLIRATRSAMVYFDIETVTISSLTAMRTRFDGKVVCIKTDYQL